MFFITLFFTATFGNRNYPTATVPWIYALLLGVVSGFIPLIIYVYGLKKIGAARAVLISSIGPVLTTSWAHIFLKETLTSLQIFGMLVVVGSIIALKQKDAPFALSFIKKVTLRSRSS